MVKIALCAVKQIRQSALTLLIVQVRAETGVEPIVLLENVVSVLQKPLGIASLLESAGRQAAFGALSRANLMVIALKKSARNVLQKPRGIVLMNQAARTLG